MPKMFLGLCSTVTLAFLRPGHRHPNHIAIPLRIPSLSPGILVSSRTGETLNFWNPCVGPSVMARD